MTCGGCGSTIRSGNPCLTCGKVFCGACHDSWAKTEDWQRYCCPPCRPRQEEAFARAEREERGE
jgi:hypothetical protein